MERFEKEILALKKGDKFNFTIPCAEAYGERDEDSIRRHEFLRRDKSNRNAYDVEIQTRRLREQQN